MADVTTTIIQRKHEAERIFAVAAFNRPDSALAQCAWLKPDAIHDLQVRQFWQGLLETKDPIQAASAVSYSYLGELAAGQFSDVNWFTSSIDQLADRIAQEQWFMAVGSRLGKLAISLAEADLAKAQSIIDDITSHAPKVSDQIDDASDIGLEFIGGLDEEPATVFTGTKLDQALGGLWQRILIVLCARPGVGKTALALQLARNVAVSGKRVLFCSLEMGKRELWGRAVCGTARVDYRDVISKRISETQRNRLIETNNRLIDSVGDRLLIDDQPQSTADLWRKCANAKPVLVIVDHLRLLSDPGDSETIRLGRISWELKKIAREFNLPVLCLAQLNRQLEARQDKEPMLSDLRDSGQIEENADIVIGLHREKEYVDKPIEKSPARARVLKFRNGPNNQVINWTFDGPGQWFE